MSDEPAEVRVPLIEETVSLERRAVDTDHVRVRTVVDVHEAVVEDQRRIGRLDIDRVAVDREVAEAPAPYRDGDVLVIPIVEERVVVEKRLFVVEELRITNTSHDEAVQIPVSLRRTRAVVERDGSDSHEAERN